MKKLYFDDFGIQKEYIYNKLYSKIQETKKDEDGTIHLYYLIMLKVFNIQNRFNLDDINNIYNHFEIDFFEPEKDEIYDLLMSNNQELLALIYKNIVYYINHSDEGERKIQIKSLQNYCIKIEKK